MNTRRCRWLPLALAAVSSTVAFGDTLEIDFNDEAFRAAYTLTNEARGLEFEFGWLHNSDNGDLASVGLHVIGLAGSGTAPVQAGVGAKVLLVDNTDSGMAIGLGGYAGYRFPRLEKLELGASLYYAPDVFSFSGVEKYLEGTVRVSYLVHERAALFLGVRTATADFEDGTEADLDDGLHIGVRLNF